MMRRICTRDALVGALVCFVLSNSESTSAFCYVPSRYQLIRGMDQQVHYSTATSASVDVVASDQDHNNRIEIKQQRKRRKLIKNSDAARQKRRMVMAPPKSLTRSPRGEATTTIFNRNHIKPALLTREEEQELSNEIRKFRKCVRVREEMVASRIKNNDEDQYAPSEMDWAKACGKPVDELRDILLYGQEARSRMVASNGGLVGSIAKRYFSSVKRANEANGGMGTILSYHDLIQEGNLGLMEAAERFDPERGFRFSTYATWWVRQRMLRAISDYSRTIRLPAHVHQMISKMRKTRKSMEQENGRQPSNLELAHHLGISVQKLEMYFGASRTVLSLESPIRASKKTTIEQTTTLGDFISSDSPTPNEDAESRCLREAILSVVGELPTNEKDVLLARFGLDDGAPKSIRETAERLGISRDRVRAFEARAINSLRHPHRNYKLKSYIAGVQDENREEKEIMNLSPEQIWSFESLSQ